MLLEATSVPVPSEVILPFAGYLVSIGRLGYWETVGLATLAGVIGALIDYYIGLFLGTKVISNYGSRFFIGDEQMMKVESLFQRHGGQIAFFSRLSPRRQDPRLVPRRERAHESAKVHPIHGSGVLRLRRGARVCRRLLRSALERHSLNRYTGDRGDGRGDHRRGVGLPEDEEEVS